MAKKYYVVHTDHVDTLDEQVNERLTQGWVLQGGVNVCVVRAPKMTEGNPNTGDAHWYTYAQAMVKDED